LYLLESETVQCVLEQPVTSETVLLKGKLRDRKYFILGIPYEVRNDCLCSGESRSQVMTVSSGRVQYLYCASFR